MEQAKIHVNAMQPGVSADVKPNASILYCGVKRAFDIVMSILALVILSPLFLVVSICIKCEDSKGKVIYKQLRTGKNGKTFYCYKFRSMYSNADEIKAQLMEQNEMDGPVFKIRNDPRVTKVGRFIRKTSIDELPQLVNILCSQMSFVGPRPLPVKEEEACNAYQRQRELAKPGLTCLWQISGRNNISFEQWIELDLKYVREQSLGLDLAILFKTIPAVLCSKGAY